jgi:thiol-disulfide isomerase/thioredoxin
MALMKRYLIISCIFCLSVCAYPKPILEKIDGSGILQKVVDKLNHLKAVSYTYKKVIDYPGEGYHYEDATNAYLEFEPSAQLTGLKYQFSNDNLLSVYNGSELFYCDKKEKTIDINNSPEINEFKNSANLFNSPVTLKNALPGIIADQSIPKILSDTSISGKSFYVVNIILQNKTLNDLGDYVPTSIKLTFSYKVFIDKETFMPVEVFQNTVNTKDNNITFFSSFNFNPTPKTENSWYASSYSDYVVEQPKKKVKFIKTGVKAPDSHLTFFTTQKPAAISDFKGKVLLIEFWIKDCGHCIEQIDTLNALSDKYKNANFKILAINSHDTKSMIAGFLNKHTIKYDLLTGGKDVDRDYGVTCFPMVVLINKEGIVIYASELDEKKLEALIGQNI